LEWLKEGLLRGEPKIVSVELKMAARNFISSVQAALQSSPYVRYSLFAIAGATALAALPGMALRIPEYHVYLTNQPLRALVELLGIGGTFGSLAAQAVGLKAPGVLVKAVERYIPAAEKLCRFNSPLASVALRVAIGAGFYLSMSRGFNPLPQKTLVSMENKTAVVTGGTSGIGFETAKALAIQGAKVILVARNGAKGEEYAKLIREAAPGAKVSVLVAVQEDLKAVAALQPKLAEEAPHGVDVLVLNAGYAPARPVRKTEAGYEESITAMHLAHFLLTKMLWGQLNPKARVVVTSSAAQSACASVDDVFAGVDKGTENAKILQEPGSLYARAKFANALFARQLGRLADSDKRGIIVTSHHPGGVATNIWTGVHPAWMGTFLNFISTFTMRNNYLGAATLIDAALGSEPLSGQTTAPNGSYYVSSTHLNSGPIYNRLLDSQEAGADLWTRSEAHIATFEPSSASWATQ
jgi:NAD(P)-dependent dehydrogenase (short-subunit alcohol dehydrogenase family)